MTEEEILVMEAGEELDNLVGVKIIRWHKVDTPRRYGWFDRGGYFRASLQWSPSKDSSAAWQVWLAVTKDHPEDWAIYSDDHGEVTVEHYPDDYKGGREAGCGDFSVDGLFPEAMCKAALLADLPEKPVSVSEVEKVWQTLGLSRDNYMTLYWDFPNEKVMAIDHIGKHTPVGDIYDIVSEVRPTNVRPGIVTNVVSFKVRKLAEQPVKEKE